MLNKQKKRDGVGWNHSIIKVKNEHEMHEKKWKFRFFFVSFIHKNKQKSVFVIRHETIVFQDMLVFPPQQEAQNGETIIISDIL